MVELMAGALAGAGVSRAPAPDGTGGNGGLFIVLRPEYLGRSEHQLSCAVRDLEAHLSTAEPMVADRPARLPGRGRARPPTDTFTLPHWLLTDLERCADRATPRYSPTEG
jgi:LDH2 family malate/lactate/ureidoglycolate dehydrogenase